MLKQQYVRTIGANGVILTTKSGKRKIPKPKIAFNTYEVSGNYKS
jgi:hypothetical protein